MPGRRLSLSYGLTQVRGRHLVWDTPARSAQQAHDEARALNFMGNGCPELHERRLLSVFTSARMQTYFGS